MTDCDHPSLTLGRKRYERLTGDRGLPRQVTFTATCDDCNRRVDVDYNIAFIDGDDA